ncbi:MAG: hypothetical protein AAFP81_18910 [Pseudomonadota bacterium]
MAVPSNPSLSEVAIEFGVSAPYSLTDFYRGGPNVPNIPANSGVPTSGAISLSQLAGAEASLPPDVTPNAVNWANISGAETASNANQTINGIDTAITLRIEYTATGAPAAILGASINGGAFNNVNSGNTITVNNGDTVRFQVVAFGTAGSVSGTVTVINQSDGDATLDTFTYSVSTVGIGP